MKILVSDRVHPRLIQRLEKLGDVDYLPKISYDKVKGLIPDYEGIIINSKIIVDDAFLVLAKKLKWIGRLGSGMDIVDFKATQKAGVKVYRSPEGNCNAVSEHALGMLLSLFNKLPASDDMVRSMEPWDRESMRGLELDGMKVGIIGFGYTGQAFAKKLKGFDVELYIYDKYKKDIPNIHPNQKQADLYDLLSEVDVLSLHIPLTSETQQMVETDFFGKMKKGAVIINSSRGEILSLAALCYSLENGHIGGACLDVFENEKILSFSKEEKKIFSRLTKFPQVVFSPHVAGWTSQSLQRIADVLADKIIFDEGQYFIDY